LQIEHLWIFTDDGGGKESRYVVAAFILESLVQFGPGGS
jgi:hypothetical protein